MGEAVRRVEGLRVVRVDPVGDPRWDAFVRAHAGDGGAHAYHLGAWAAMLRRAYGAAPRHLAVEDGGGRLVAALPVMREGGLKRGGRLASMMLGLRGGPLGGDDATAAMLLSAAADLVGTGDGTRLLATSEWPGLAGAVPGVHVLTNAPAWITALPGDPDALRRTLRRHSRNLWRSLNKADAAPTVVRPVRSRADLWRFYLLYSRTMHRHRVLPRSWLEITGAHRLLAPSGDCRVWLVERDGAVVAGCLFLVAGATIEALYAGDDPAAREDRPYHAVYWHAIEWAIARGLTHIDWGSAPPESSLGRFKRQWAAEPRPLFRYVVDPALAPGDAPSEASLEGQAVDGGGRFERAWDRIPAPALGVAATVAHRVL